MTEENKISRGLGEYEGASDVKLGKKGTPGKEIKYTGLDGNNKGKAGLKAVYLIGTIDEASRKFLATLKPGGKFVVVKTKKPGEEYYNVSGFESAEGYTPKEAWTGNKAGGGGGKYNPAAKKEYDTTGVKVGAARNQAIAFLSATKGAKFTLDDVDVTAYEIVKRQQVQEDVVRSGASAPGAATESNTQDLEDGDDDDIDF